MSYYITKIAVTSLLVILVSEVARRSTLGGAILASLPIVSVLSIIWLYSETRDPTQIAALSRSIVWLVLPSLALFIALPILLNRGYNFYLSLILSAGATIVLYLGTISIARYLGFRL